MTTRSRYSNFGDVDEYLLSLDERKRVSLEKLRATIRRLAPQAAEMMRFNMPYYEYNGMLCAFTAQKDYLSFYLRDGAQVDKYKRELPHLTFGNGCIRFQDFAELPEGLIERILTEALAGANAAKG